MLKAGPAKKVTIYVGEDHQYHGQSVYAAILEFLFYRKVSGATVTAGHRGIRRGSSPAYHSHPVLTENLPMKWSSSRRRRRSKSFCPSSTRWSAPA